MPALQAGDSPKSRPGASPGAGTSYSTKTEIMLPKKRKTPRKRGPKEERLVIRDDPAEALARLLKAPPKRGK